MLKPIEYEKLIDVLSKKGFESRLIGEELMAIFYPPPIEEAGGEEGVTGQRYYIIKFKIRDGMAYYESTTLMEDEKPIKVLTIEEVEPWLETILGDY
ncbi:hypothetical protein V6M85_05460 [Sulfolobus tengchongensis]|uniref:Uncharacterized protein n=1 Tax=Sulfolobus tengchongensis TaxID=207809 RepID=A0AAX4L595_9CREN